MRIVCISDTHELHRELDVPSGDMLIHAGDFTFFGRRTSQLRDFNEWLGELPHRHKLVIPGNHEAVLQDEATARRLITNAVLLINEGVSLGGFSVWGSPVTPLNQTAFGMPNSADRERHWSSIPENTDILITHGPPYGILDMPRSAAGHEGCPQLLEATRLIKPKLHVFGHVHGGRGAVRLDNTLFVNAAVFDQEGGLDAPIVLELTARGRR